MLYTYTIKVAYRLWSEYSNNFCLLKEWPRINNDSCKGHKDRDVSADLWYLLELLESRL